MACIRDAKPEIETITMTYDSVEVYTDPGTGGTLTITKSGSHAFTRKWLAEFAGKFLNEDGSIKVKFDYINCKIADFRVKGSYNNQKTSLNSDFSTIRVWVDCEMV